MKQIIICGAHNLDARAARALIEVAEHAWSALSHEIHLSRAFTLIALDALNQESSDDASIAFEQAVI